jgi:U3 small nucleolar ribonucleoprotein component
MNEIPNMSAADRKKPMQPQEISEVFSQLGLQKDEDREKFRSLAEVKTPENEKVRIYLSGTTTGMKEAQGGNYA